MTHRVQSFSILLCLSAAIAWLSLEAGHRGHLDGPIVRATQAMRSAPTRPEGRWGYPSEPWRFRHGYVIGQPGKFTPWSAEVLTMRKLAVAQVQRKDQFRADDDVPIEYRATLKDYEGAELDRGHETPAGDCLSSEAAMTDSFLLSNMMPQAPELNRGQWAQLERHVRELVTDGKTTVYVFTGPAFLPDHQGRVSFDVLGSHTNFIPTHCYKVALVTRDDAPLSAHAWMAPNVKEPGPFDSWAVSVDDVEAAVGLDFFAGLTDDLENKLEVAGPK